MHGTTLAHAARLKVSHTRQPLVTSNRTVQALLVALDAVIIVFTATIANETRSLLGLADSAQITYDALIVSAVGCVLWMVLLASSGSYRVSNLGTGVAEYKRVWTSSVTVATLLVLAAFLFKYPLSRIYYTIFVLLGTGLLMLGRFAMRRVVHSIRRRGALTNPVIVVGNASNADEIVNVLRREPWLGYDVIGVMTPDLEPLSSDVPLLGTPNDVVKAAVTNKASVVIFAEGAFPSAADFRRMAWQLEDKHTDMIIVPALTDVSAERLEIRPVAGLPLVHVDKPQAAQAGRSLKRVFDIIGSLILIILTAPLMAIVAIAIKIEDGGPIIFKQQRTGRHGKPFYCLKFRSMCVDAEAKLAELAARNESNGVLFKIADDPRVTKVGKFLRHLSIDEVPQFFNVLLGDMSLVGPRPALPAEVAKYSPDARRRLQVRPGMSGLWQVSGRADLSWDDTVRLDLYYVDNWSFLQDLSILMRTIGAVLRSRGAY